MLRSVKYGVHAAVVAGLVSAPVVWQQLRDHTVDLVVDGRTSQVSTAAGTVGQVLAGQNLRVGPHDLLAPSASTKVGDGTRIVLRHGRLLHLTVDGQAREVWTTAPTVASALDALGYTAKDFVSVSRDQRLPLTPSSFTVRTPQLVTVIHDGQRETVVTTDATVGGLLADLGVSVGPLDRLSTLVSAPITPDSIIRLQRVVEKTQSKSVALAYQTVQRKDSSLAAGTTKVLHAGRSGSAKVTYALVYVDGKFAGRMKVSSQTTAAPQTQVVAVGTNTSMASTPSSAQAIAQSLLSSYGWSDDQFSCLVSMWNRESGWRTNAANPSGAYGIPQSLPGSKMASAGPDWQTSAETQIKWGLGYIAARYGSPCGAWSFWQAHDYY